MLRLFFGLMFCFFKPCVGFLHKGDIGAVGPHLSSGFTIVTETENVLARRKVSGNLDQIADGIAVPVDTLTPIARCRKRGAHLVAIGRDCRHLVAPRAVRPWCAWARLAWHGARRHTALVREASVRRAIRVVGAGEAAWAKEGGRHGHHGPHGSRRRGAFRDKGGLVLVELEHRAVGEDNGLFVLDKVQRVLLEARFRELGEVAFREWAETVRVSATVVVTNRPHDFRRATTSVGRGLVVWQRLEHLRAHITVLGIGRLRVVTGLGARRPRVRSTSQTAGVHHRGRTGCAPRVVLVDVEVGEWSGVTVDGPVLGVREGLVLAKTAQVNLTTSTGVVARWASNETALRVPERSLSVVALVAREVRAPLRVDPNEVVDRVT
eukprot:m.43212 g.43212  ORF g.43212 m.43212 type:complete len:379 (+) comp6376_c0_seq1:160-1296(+)